MEETLFRARADHPSSGIPDRGCRLILLLLGIASLAAGADGAAPPLLQADHFMFSHLTINQGLSQSNVYCIVQDRRGFMWFGTEDGLNRFDGT